MSSQHAADLDLARRCAAGDEQAWQRFVLEYRPLLYRAADALDRTGGAREIADSLYAELYGLKEDAGGRRSLFRYFEGRSSLATWLRAVLAQRFVDRLRAQKRLEPLPEEDDTPKSPATAAATPDPERRRYVAALGQALGRAVAKLDPRERLRLGCYYVQQLTLAQTGTLLKEHEATVSRQLARTRQTIRRDVERELRAEAGFTDDQIAACFASVAGDPGPIDAARLLSGPAEDGHYASKEEAPERSI